MLNVNSVNCKFDSKHDVMHIFLDKFSHADTCDEIEPNVFVYTADDGFTPTKIEIVDYTKKLLKM